MAREDTLRRHSNMDIHWLAIINSFVLMLLILQAPESSPEQIPLSPGSCSQGTRDSRNTENPSPSMRRVG